MRIKDRLVIGANDVFDILGKTMGELDQEEIRVVLRNARGRIIDILTIAMGTAGEVEVHPRDVFREAIRQNAVSIILVHNHPSGDTSPSEMDKAMTVRMVSAGELLGIDVVDHIVVTSDDYTSILE